MGASLSSDETGASYYSGSNAEMKPVLASAKGPGRGRNQEALPWLQRSIAITPGTGRTHLLPAAAYQLLNRPNEAKVAWPKAMELRPGSTAGNVSLPAMNINPVFREAHERILQAEVEAGLPER
jgi:Flp pilus assembly protein TadD